MRCFVARNGLPCRVVNSRFVGIVEIDLRLQVVHIIFKPFHQIRDLFDDLLILFVQGFSRLHLILNAHPLIGANRRPVTMVCRQSLLIELRIPRSELVHVDRWFNSPLCQVLFKTILSALIFRTESQKLIPSAFCACCGAALDAQSEASLLSHCLRQANCQG